MIEVTNLTKKYGDHIAVDHLSFRVEKGQIYGFLGPNGAGKSTTMNIITGYLAATEGTVTIDGKDVQKDPEEAKRAIGYLPELPPLYTDMTVTEYLEFVADLKGIKKNEIKPMLADIMDKIKITHVSGKVIKNLSKGYRQRVGLAQALVGYPEVLILDEPTVGLDPKQIIEIRDVIKDLSKTHTIILSSHILSEVSAVCNRVIIINKGRVIAVDTPERLSDNLGQNSIKVKVKGDRDAVLSAFKEDTAFTSAEEEYTNEDGTVELVIKGAENTDPREAAFDNAVRNGFKLLMLKSDKMSLEEVFLQVTENAAEEENAETSEEETETAPVSDNTEKTENKEEGETK